MSNTSYGHISQKQKKLQTDLRLYVQSDAVKKEKKDESIIFYSSLNYFHPVN